LFTDIDEQRLKVLLNTSDNYREFCFKNYAGEFNHSSEPRRNSRTAGRIQLPKGSKA